MAAENWYQKFLTNPITSNQNDDLLYWARSPYGTTNDAVINWQNFSAQFALSTLTSAHIYVGNGSNVATSVAVSGDVALTNTGAMTVSKIGGVPIALAGSFTTLGAFAVNLTFTGATNVTFPTSGTLATTSQLPSLPLSLTNGGTNASLTASNGGIFYSTASAGAILSGTATAGQLLLSGATAPPIWSTSTYPATNAINTLLYASSANVMTALATANSSGLLTNSSGLPAWVAYTGTGAPMLNTSPKIITSLLDTNGNTILAFNPLANAVNYIAINNQSAGNTPSFAAVGSDTNIELAINSKGTGGINLKGITGGGSAPVGYVGEFISSVIAAASGVVMTSGMAVNITSISLSAGDWDVWGNVNVTGISIGVTALLGWISSSSTTVPDTSLYTGSNAGTYTSDGGICVPQLRFSLSGTTTIYLTGYFGFTGNAKGCGGIYARRAH